MIDLLKWFRKPTPITLPKFDKDRAIADIVERKLSESVGYAPPFDLISPFSNLYDGQNLLFPIFPGRYDSRVSSNYLFLTETQLDMLRVYSRFLYELNPTAKAPLHRLCDYTIAKGFTYTVVAKDDDNSSISLIEKSQDIVDNFIDKNDWHSYEQEIFLRSHRDGETFIELFPQEDYTAVRIVEPETIRNPGSAKTVGGTEAEWKYGILTKAPDLATPLKYAVMHYADEENIRIVDAKQMLHIKVNVDRQIKRGLSDFLALQEIIQNIQKLLRAGVLGESVRQSIAYIRQFAQADLSTVQTLQNNNTSYEIPVLNTGKSPTLQPVQIVQPGSVVDIPDGLEHQPPPLGASNNAVLMLQASYQQLASFWGVPQWIVSADTGNTNFAASLTAESPFIKNIERRQSFYANNFKTLMKRVLAVELTEEEMRRIDIDVECQSAHVRDAKQETEQNQILHSNGIMSKRTWQLREELDPDMEDAQILTEPPPLAQQELTNDEGDNNTYNKLTKRNDI